MAKMLGNTPHGQHSVCKSWLCGRKPAEDALYRRGQRAREEAEVRAYVSRLWAEDWDSPEDAAYDEEAPGCGG